MTREQWKQVEEALKSMFKTVKLKVDDYSITLRLERVTTYKNTIIIYVNGEFDTKWLFEDCEERRRFCQKHSKAVYKESFLKGLHFTKKEKEKYKQMKHDWYEPFWKSFNSLKKHLITNNKSIELVEIR